MVTTVWHFYSLPNRYATDKFSANGNTRVFRNKFSAEEHTSKNQKTRNQFCTLLSLDTWKAASGWKRI